LGNNANDDTSLSNAKLMLDKNLVAVLTTAISDVDINYPHSKVILNTMLRPLEQLTKLAIKAEDVAEDEKGDKNQDEGEGDGEETHEDGMQNLVPRTETEQEEAPDLYRHSSLGMLDGGSVIDEDEYHSDEFGDIFPSGEEEEE
jgi:E3 ubiquitin-protein ligase HUWE1